MAQVGSPLTLTASYPGDSNFAPVSEDFDYTVSKADSTVTLSVGSPATTSTYGQTVTFLARVATDTNAGNLNCTVKFFVGASATPIASVTVTNQPVGTEFTGILSYTDGASTFDPNVGTHTVTAVYTDTSGFYNNDTSNSLTHTINKAETTVVVDDSLENSIYGQSVTFTATITNTSTGVTPQGSVTFTGASGLCTNVAVSGSGNIATATCTPSPLLSAASYTITAAYDGGTNFNSHNDTETHTVSKAATSTNVTSSDADNITVIGESVTFTATVTNTDSTGVRPLGTITFTNDGTSIAGCTNLTANNVSSNSSSATCMLSNLSVSGSPHSISAAYTASPANYTDSNDNGSPLVHTVNKGDVTASVASSVNPSVSGQSVTFSPTLSIVSPAAGTLTGTITYQSGGSDISGCVGVSLTTNCVVTLNASGGNPSITVIYSGDGNFNSDTSSGLTQTVNKADTIVTTTNLNIDITCPGATQACFQMTSVSVTSPGTGTPTGTVTFKVYDAGNATCGDGDDVLANTVTGTLINAFSSALTLATNDYCVTATYDGDANYNASAESSKKAFSIP